MSGQGPVGHDKPLAAPRPKSLADSVRDWKDREMSDEEEYRQAHAASRAADARAINRENGR